MAYTPANVMVGVATLYTAPANTPNVSPNLPTGATWPTPWSPQGLTEAGVTLSYDPKVNEIFAEEQTTPVLTPVDTVDVQVSATFMEDILANLALSYGTGSVTTAVVGTSRTVADGVLNSTTTVTSATAAFTNADLYKGLTGIGIPAGAYIQSVTNATTVVLNVAATATGSGVSITVVGAPATSSYSPGITTNTYAVGFEALNAFSKYRRLYIPTAMAASNKVDTSFRRAKNARMYAATFRAICPTSSIQLVDATT